VEKQLEGPLRTAITFLEGQGYRYAVIGGIALAQWGVVRATRDVDIKVFVPNTDYSGRDKDWPDVEALLIAQDGKLDEAYVENWLEQFAEALEKPEILTKYRQLVERIKTLRTK
jgi:hypothetical protein